MLWLTQEALRNDLLRRAAQSAAELEQRVSLALWRMDTELAPIIAEEVARSPSAYRLLHIASADASPQPRAPQSFPQQQAAQSQSPQQTVAPRDQQQQVIQPPHVEQLASPLPLRPVAEPPAFVLLQFEALADGSWHSPQVREPIQPRAAQNATSLSASDQTRAARLAELAAAIDVPQLLAQLPTTSLPSLSEVGSHLLAQRSDSPGESQENDELRLFEGNRPDLAKASPGGKAASVAGKMPQVSKSADFARRDLRYQSLAGQSLLNAQQRAGAAGTSPADDPFQSLDDPFAAIPADDPGRPWNTEQVGITRPLWVGERLLLARRVGMNGHTSVQGAWLDWAQLKARLLEETEDLLPAADLLPIREAATADLSRMLAGLPVRLAVGPATVTEVASPSLRFALWMGWSALALAIGAAAALLHGVMALSERRAAFVSSVTHELRTPLTTFRMYAEMLVRGMVPDAAKRQEYLKTLQREAERLTLLVENVLAYARLERGRRPDTGGRTTVGAILERVRPRLDHRAAEAGMQCVFQLDDQTARIEIATDASVVEQILFNLVDNAAKYARTATDRRIHVGADRNAGWIALSVRDHGAGMPARLQSRKLQAFFKTAEQSAESAPGVGLGLALCRRLARQLRGRLEVTASPEGGTIASLILPVECSLAT
jgi:signal transduction histidine kinase